MAVGRTIAAPLLFINLLMYLLVVGFASWCLNRFINGQTNHPSKLSLSLSLSLTHTHTNTTHILLWGAQSV
jgi:flagellar biogenesis protein FliO